MQHLSEIADTCVNSALRKASRLVGAIYDDALRPVGLRGTQFNLLVALAQLDRASVNDLAGVLATDRTTLSRNLGPLERDGLVRTVPAADGRMRLLVLTALGRRRLRAALPCWENAQAQMSARLGKRRTTAFTTDLKEIAARLDR